MVSIEDFQKLDIRVGKIVKVEDFPEVRKLFTLDNEKAVISGELH